jgi:membrane fusion protein (multidrug efflux system)
MTVRRVHTLIAVVGIAVVSGAAWWFQNRSQPAPTQANAATPPRTGAAPSGGAAPGAAGPATVEVGKVEAVTLADDAQAVGSVRARQGVMMRPEVSGRIERIGFIDGQRVKRGQLLVQLDDTLQQAQLKQALAQASIARTNLQRSRELASQGFISQSAVDQNAAALEVAQAQVALARAQAQRMQIVAPFDAVAGIRSISLGDYVKDGADLVQLEDISSVWVDFRLPERFMARVKPGQGVEVSLDAMPGRSFRGHVEALDSLIDADGRSLLVRSRLDNPGGELKSGMFARTRIVFSERANAIVVPEEALVPQGGKQFIVKVVDGPNGKVTQRLEAKIGARLLGKAEILEGLAVGDIVVTAGQARVMRADGLPVKVVDISRPPAPARAASGASAPRPAATA